MGVEFYSICLRGSGHILNPTNRVSVNRGQKTNKQTIYSNGSCEKQQKILIGATFNSNKSLAISGFPEAFMIYEHFHNRNNPQKEEEDSGTSRILERKKEIKRKEKSQRERKKNLRV